MSEATEHDMRHPVQLIFCGLVELRVIIAMYHRPPGRHAVNQCSPIFESQLNPLGGFDRVGWQGPFERRIRVPDVMPFKVEPVVVIQVCIHMGLVLETVCSRF